jgi:hypothetical protein
MLPFESTELILENEYYILEGRRNMIVIKNLSVGLEKPCRFLP